MNTQTKTPPATTTQPAEKSYVIVHLATKNYCNIRAEGVEITPNRSLVTITGLNGAGKSSILNSIYAVLTGNMCERPVRDGASKAETECDFGNFTAKLTIPANGAARLTLRSKDGADIKSPRTFLEQHSNEILLDLVNFVRLGEKAEGRRRQGEILRKLVGLDFTALDAARKQFYDDRTAANRELEAAAGKLANYPQDPEAPAEEVLVSALIGELTAIETKGQEELKAARRHNEANRDVRKRHTETKSALDQDRSRLADIETQIAELEEQLAVKRDAAEKWKAGLKQSQSALEKCVAEVSALQDKSEEEIRAGIALATQPIKQQIEAADSTNLRVRNARRRKEIAAEVTAAQVKVVELTTKIEKLDQDRESQLSNAKYPLEGLKFDESGILLNGRPLGQSSTSQQYKAALAIGFALKPRIPVVLIRDLSVFDDDSRKELVAMLDAHGAQAWAEEVARIDGEGNIIREPFTILIEDGGLKE